MENEELREKQRIEVIERLKILQKYYMLHQNVLKDFKADNTIYYSETINRFLSGILYWLNNKPLYVEKVKEYEKENQAFVYYCILNHTEFGDMLDMLYVSNNVDNWELEREELQEGLVNVFTSDLVNDYYSESGVISISGINGGIVRY